MEAIILILSLILGIMIVGVFIYGLVFIVKPYMNEKNRIREIETKNKTYELFASIDPEAVQKELDTYFERYVNRYITYKFIANKVIYIKQDDIEKMVSDTTKLIMIEISELYIYYIKILRAIDNNEDLIQYIYSRVSTITIDTVANYNSANLS
jgi:hypothetical protein